MREREPLRAADPQLTRVLLPLRQLRRPPGHYAPHHDWRPLWVLLPNDPDSFSRHRDLVPTDTLGDIERAKIIITKKSRRPLAQWARSSKDGARIVAGSLGARLMVETAQTFEPVSNTAIPSAIAVKLNTARHELLDLSTRNRLINTSRHSRSSRLIEISNANGPRLYREFVMEGRAVGFLSRDSENDPVESGPDVEEIGSTAAPRPRREMRLQTFLTADSLRTRLLSLHLDAKTFEEEQGVGILFVAIGFLKWYEAANSDVERYAPLLLVPVNLDRGTARERFRLRWNQDDPTANLSLIAMLRREHGIVLRDWEDEEDLDPEAYFDTVTAAISDQPRWAVRPNDVAIGFFSFAKYLMYRDLDAANWPEHLDRLDFIKADIEGWEVRLLHGAESTLKHFRPRLLLELSGTALARAGDRLVDAFAFLAARGYRAFRFEPGASLAPVSAPVDGDFWFIPADDLAGNASFSRWRHGSEPGP